MPDPAERPLRIAHLTTVAMSLELLLGAELDEDVAAGHTVLGISGPDEYVPRVEARGVAHVPVRGLTRAWDVRRDLAAARELAGVLRGLHLDVLHTHTPKAGVLGRVLGRLAGVPVVVNTCHGLWAPTGAGRAGRTAVLVVELLAAQLSHAELYQNDTDRAALAPWVRPRKAKTVGNGIDLARFGPDPAARSRVRAELGVGDDTVLVGGVGRRVAEKGIRELAAAARALGDGAAVVWVGPEDLDKPDALAADEQGLRFLGARHDMPAVYAALDVFALPSYREGFSRSAMEAAASGCALVLSDIRGCREIGEHGREVLLVAPGDAGALTGALERVVADAALRERLAAAAQRRARVSFDQRTVARTSLATYREVAARRRLGW